MPIETQQPPPGPEPGAARPPALEARGLTKSFAGVHALRGVDLVVRPGEVHALMGRTAPASPP